MATSSMPTMTIEYTGVDMKYKIQKVQSVTGRTKILWVVRGVVRKVWHLPKWMSTQRWVG